MKVFELHLDCSKCDGCGIAMVAAPSYEEAVKEYVKNGDCGKDVAEGIVKFTKSSDIPILGLEYAGGTQIISDCFCFCQEL